MPNGPKIKANGVYIGFAVMRMATAMKYPTSGIRPRYWPAINTTAHPTIVTKHTSAVGSQ